jgi:RND superfamily putative drug exporter
VGAALLDTVVVRSVLVTALNLDLGRRVWWPGRLGRQLQATAQAAPPDSMAPTDG